MTDITVIGLGLMGAALARTLGEAGHSVTVWNRSPEKMRPFAEAGVETAADVGAAIEASPVALICIDNYSVTDALLAPPEIAGRLKGRTVVQLSTGTPKEAAEAAGRITALGAAYIDGAILAGPVQIGTAEGHILLCGDAVAYDKGAGLLGCLGERVVFLGDNIRAAAVLDLAWLATCYGRFLSLVHGANMCRAEGVDIAAYIDVFPDDPSCQTYLAVVRDGSYDDYTASLGVWGAALERIRQQGRDAGIGTDFPDFAASFFERAVAAGLAEKNVMALIKVLDPDA